MPRVVRDRYTTKEVSRSLDEVILMADRLTSGGPYCDLLRLSIQELLQPPDPVA